MKILKIILITLLLVANLFSFGQNNVQSILNEYKDSLKNYGIVALVDDGKTKQTGAVGWAYENQPINIDHRFCIGSVSKLYTSTLILKLQELDLLSIEDSISKFIPKHEFIDGSISIGQLLNHTSGITDISGAELANAALLNPYLDYSDAYLYSLINTIDFSKGTKHSYSNTNYFLLRKIIERVADKSYQSVLNELIIQPLKLTNTFPYHSNKIDGLAHPILGNQDLHEIPKIAINQISIGIGNIVSDANDVNSFIRALFIDNIILNQQSLSLMLDIESFGKTNIGLGVFEENFGNRAVKGHTGRAISYISYAFVDEKTGLSFVLLCNNANDVFIDQVIGRICEKGK